MGPKNRNRQNGFLGEYTTLTKQSLAPSLLVYKRTASKKKTSLKKFETFYF